MEWLPSWSRCWSEKPVMCGSIPTPSTTKGREIYPAINLVLKTSGTFVVWGSTPLSSSKHGIVSSVGENV